MCISDCNGSGRGNVQGKGSCLSMHRVGGGVLSKHTMQQKGMECIHQVQGWGVMLYKHTMGAGRGCIPQAMRQAREWCILACNGQPRGCISACNEAGWGGIIQAYN